MICFFLSLGVWENSITFNYGGVAMFLLGREIGGAFLPGNGLMPSCDECDGGWNI